MEEWKKTKTGPTESSLRHWLFIVNQPAGLQFLHHHCGDGRDFEEHFVQNSWPVRKPRPIERKSVAQGRGGSRTSTPAFAGTAQRFSQMASESPSHTWWQETTFRVSSLNILGFSFSSDSLFHFLRLWACPCYDLPSYLSSTFPSLDWFLQWHEPRPSHLCSRDERARLRIHTPAFSPQLSLAVWLDRVVYPLSLSSDFCNCRVGNGETYLQGPSEH